MGSKHKQAQSARREARRLISKHRKELSERLGKFDEVIKPKPKFVPPFIWRLGAKIYFDAEKLGKYFPDIHTK